MRQTKICLHCGKVFETDLNSRKFCRKKCAVYFAKKHTKAEKRFLCHWCGEVFSAYRKKRFCSSDCQSVYMHKYTPYRRKEVKIPVKITIEDAVKGSKEEKLTYGKYVSLKKI